MHYEPAPAGAGFFCCGPTFVKEDIHGGFLDAGCPTHSRISNVWGRRVGSSRTRYADTNQFPLIPKLGMSGAPGDGDRFDLAVRQIVGKRLLYKELTGKMGAIQEQPF